MTSNLTVKERNLLQVIEDSEELRSIFFRKAKGLKWFDELSEKGYFNPENNPKLVPAKQEGYVNIPFWPALEYLTKTAPELKNEKNKNYAYKFIQILINTTNYAKENAFSNYHTWWKFAEIFEHIPYNLLSVEDVEIIDYWLDDKYDHGIIAEIISEKFVYSLLNSYDPHAIKLVKKIIEIIYKVRFTGSHEGNKHKKIASLRFDYYHGNKISKQIAKLAGEKIGVEVVKIFDSYLKNILEQLQNDSISYIWQPAIEYHEQNKHRKGTENIILYAYRDSLDGFFDKHDMEALPYVIDMLNSNYKVINRLAINLITKYNTFAKVTFDQIINVKFLNYNYRHEMWHFFNKCYPLFTSVQKNNCLDLMSKIRIKDDDGKDLNETSAYHKLIWLSSIKDFGERERKLYIENFSVTKAEPDHPDFSYYMTVGWTEQKSPKTLEELRLFSYDELINYLKNYEDKNNFNDEGLEGLVKTLKQFVKTESQQFHLKLKKFASLDLPYICEIIEAYREMWNEKNNLPWEQIWGELFEFCLAVITIDDFWNKKNKQERRLLVANRHWVVSSIARLIEDGTKSDEHAFSEKYIKQAEDIISLLLKKEEGNKFDIQSDAVSISINSSRGHCIIALINLTLRLCRLADKTNNNHHDIWISFQKYYDDELFRADNENPEYEFATLVTNYLPNFLYMSKDWILGNLNKIFDQDNYLKWLCAMQGYAYVNTQYAQIYNHLKLNGDYLKALEDENIKDKTTDKVVQNIAIAFLNDFESLDETDSLINTIINRKDYEELSQLVWFLSSLRKKYNNKLNDKVFQLWLKIIENIDFNSKVGQKLASQLCNWAVFIDELDDEKLELLKTLAPYSDESYNSHILLECLSILSEKQPYESFEIWMNILDGTTPDYPEDAIKKLLSNLVKAGKEGERKAKQITSKYLKNGIQNPQVWLNEIIRT